jgi:hypothetical protein
MPCPDEDTFARFVEGLLRPEAAAQIERHVDGCARCADLAAEFGRSFAEAPADAGRGSGKRMAPLALAVAAVVHVVWAIVIRGAAGALRGVVPPPFADAYLHYATLWAPAGSIVALAAAFCLLRRVAGGRFLALLYAWLSLPSIVVTPLALLVMDAQRRDRAPR